jgi:hypothetical protein
MAAVMAAILFEENGGMEAAADRMIFTFNPTLKTDALKYSIILSLSAIWHCLQKVFSAPAIS